MKLSMGLLYHNDACLFELRPMAGTCLRWNWRSSQTNRRVHIKDDDDDDDTGCHDIL